MQGHKVVPNDVFPEIRRDIPNAQPAFRRALICMRADAVLARLTMPAIPLETLRENRPRIISRMKAQAVNQIAVHGRGIGLEGHGLAGGGKRLLDFSPSDEGLAEIIVGFGMIGLEPDRLPVRADGPVDLLFVTQGIAQIIPSLRMGGLQPKRLAIGDDRVSPTSRGVVGAAEIVPVNGGGGGIEFKGAAMGPNCLVESTDRTENQREIALKIGAQRLQRDGSTDQIDGQLHAATLRGHEAK